MSTQGLDRRRLITFVRRGALGLLALAVVAAIIYAFQPPVIPVDMATVTVGPLQVVVREEGKTRIRDRYVISSSLAGRLLRIELDPGDPVVSGETVLASIEPADPSLLDARSLAQAEAKVAANEAALLRAQAELKRTDATLERAQLHFKRMRTLQESRSASSEEFEDAELSARSATELHAAAKFNVTIAQFELEQARAALTHFRPATKPNPNSADWRMDVTSPISGSVLRVLQESSAVVSRERPSSKSVTQGSRNRGRRLKRRRRQDSSRPRDSHRAVGRRQTPSRRRPPSRTPGLHQNLRPRRGRAAGQHHHRLHQRC